MKLIIMRHLLTKDNIETRFCSGDRDISILPNQAINSKIIQIMGKMNGYVLAHTGLKRSLETIQVLKKALNYSGNIFIFPEFVERKAGKLAGLKFNKIQSFFPSIKTPNELWKFENLKLGLETLNDFLLRIEQGLYKIRDVGKKIILCLWELMNTLSFFVHLNFLVS